MASAKELREDLKVLTEGGRQPTAFLAGQQFLKGS